MSNFKKILLFLNAKQKKIYYLLICLNFISIIIELLGISLLAVFINNFLSENSNSKLDFISHLEMSNNQYFFTLVSIFSLKAILIIAIKKFQINFYKNLENAVYKKIINHYLNFSWSQFISKPTHYYIKIIKEVIPTYIGKVLVPFSEFISQFIWIILSLSFLLYYDYKITLIVIILAIFLYFVINLTFKKKLNILGHKRLESYQRVQKYLTEVFFNFKLVKIMLSEKFFENKINQNNYDFISSNYQSKFISSLPRVLIELFFVIFILLLFLTQKQATLIETLILFIAIIVRTIPSLTYILQTKQSMSFGKFAMKEMINVYENLNQKDYINKNENSNVKIQFDKQIELKNINFKFEEKIIFEDFNFVIKKNSFNVIKGKSGSGKSTLINILMGILKPISGNVLIDDNFLNLNDESWLKNIGYVPQENLILEGTIQDNITFFDEKINIVDFNKAINFAGLESFLKNLPNGENTILKENLSNISGGEAKRISIARALYRNPKILILDEPTNGLDDQTKSNLVDNIYKLKGKTTIIIITHLNDFNSLDSVIDLNK